MAEWWEAYDVDVFKRETCWHCEKPLEPPAIFFPHGTYTTRGKTRMRAMQVCALCFMHEAATVEARDECRKFVEIDGRCVCGRAALAVIGECVTCHRERRMLDREWAEIKMARRILSSLRKEIKVGKSTLNGGTSRASV